MEKKFMYPDPNLQIGDYDKQYRLVTSNLKKYLIGAGHRLTRELLKKYPITPYQAPDVQVVELGTPHPPILAIKDDPILVSEPTINEFRLDDIPEDAISVSFLEVNGTFKPAEFKTLKGTKTMLRKALGRGVTEMMFGGELYDITNCI
jgi:hypothetical protein